MRSGRSPGMSWSLSLSSHVMSSSIIIVTATFLVVTIVSVFVRTSSITAWSPPLPHSR